MITKTVLNNRNETVLLTSACVNTWFHPHLMSHLVCLHVFHYLLFLYISHTKVLLAIIYQFDILFIFQFDIL